MVRRPAVPKATPVRKPAKPTAKAAAKQAARKPAPRKAAPKPAPKAKPKARTRRPPAAPQRELGKVETGVEQDIRELARRKKSLGTGGLAASARALAREMDVPKNSATSKSMCARALAETLQRLRDLAPPLEEADGIDDLASRRSARIAS